VQELKDAIAAAEGLLLVSPEYNNSIPGVLKNAIDWLSRPGDDIPRVFRGKPVAVIGATLGSLGTVLGQNAWLPVLRTLGMRPWFEDRLAVARANQAIGADGRLADAELRSQLQRFMAGFSRFAAAEGERQFIVS
jgi:NAD(P)H-dependent FMN reductase